MDRNFTKGFAKIAGSAMDALQNSVNNAFGFGRQQVAQGAKPLNVPKPPPPPSNVSPGGGQTMNARMGNPFG